MSFLIGQQFRVFVKPADKPARIRCELKAWSVHLGERAGRAGVVEVACFEVEPTDVYESVIAAAARNVQPVQVGVQFRDGDRYLLTGYVSEAMPMIGMQLLHCFRMDVTDTVRSTAD